MRRIAVVSAASFGFAALSCLLPAAAQAQDFDAVQIRTVQVTDTVYMLVGAGGNIALSVGDDGVFIVDDQFAPLTEKIKAAIAGLTDRPVQFVINTHFHYDHTDGNENLGGEGAIIVAHENSRVRMSSDQLIEAFDRRQEAYSPQGLPKVTFSESMRFHYNGQTIDVFHTPEAHTDGDAIIWFREANVVHAGDVFVGYFPPFIDQSNGGSLDGVIAATERLAAMADDETRFIPGHGEIAGRGDVIERAARLRSIRDRIVEHIEQGRTVDEVIAADPTGAGDAAATWVRYAYEELSSRR